MGRAKSKIRIVKKNLQINNLFIEFNFFISILSFLALSSSCSHSCRTSTQHQILPDAGWSIETRILGHSLSLFPKKRYGMDLSSSE